MVQSKSGTGKTLVFGAIALEKLNPDIDQPQALILSPTREIAVQTADTLKTIGKYLPRFKAEVVIGGQSLQEDRKRLQGCSVVVASPGRILHLIELNVFNTKHINLLILDEVDLLTELNFNLDEIFGVLDRQRLQVVTVSATLGEETQKKLKKYMKDPIGITPAKEVPVLVGIGQFVCRLPRDEPGVEMLRKFAKLKEILSKVTFKQCFVFTNSQSLAESYKKLLAKEDWPSEVITGAYEQSQRLNVLRKLKAFKIRVLLSTDLMARGIDAENVNLVVNMDVPRNGMVYLHRIGRAGRFGTKGVAVTLVATEEQEKQFVAIQEQFGMQTRVLEMPANIESKKVWQMVEEVQKWEPVTEVDGIKSGKIEDDEEEDDALALLLDSSAPTDIKGEQGEIKKDSNPIANYLEEFEKFCEDEEVGDAKNVQEEESASLARSVDESHGEDEIRIDIPELMENTKIHKRAIKKNKSAKNDGCCLNKWHTLFDMQHEMIFNHVQRNRESRRTFGKYYNLI